VVPGVPFVWSSDTPVVATVLANLGLATAVSGPGQALITATAAGISGSATLVLSGGVSMTVQIIGGPMGNAGQAGVRLLRNDPTTGAFLAEATTDALGMAAFAGIATPRTTISVVDDGDPTEGGILTLLDIPVGDLVLHGSASSPPVLATFDVDLNPVPSGQAFGSVTLGAYGEGDAQFVFGTSALGIQVREVQPDGLFSLLTEADGSSGRLEGCGMLLDQDPATATGTLPIDTTLPVTSVPYTASAPIAPSGVIVLRKGMDFELFLDEAPNATSGTFLLCTVLDADAYAFCFEDFDDLTGSGVGTTTVSAAPPASFNVTVPSLSLANPAFDFASQTVSWTASGSDLGQMDASDPLLCWSDAGGNFFERCFFVDPAQTSIVLPELPADLSAFEPPATGVFVEADIFGADAVAGYDALLDAVSAAGGTLEGVLFQSSAALFAFAELDPFLPLTAGDGRRGQAGGAPGLRRSSRSTTEALRLRTPRR